MSQPKSSMNKASPKPSTPETSESQASNEAAKAEAAKVGGMNLPTLATKEEWNLIKEQAMLAHSSQVLPETMSVSQAIVVGAYGKALGLTFYESVNDIYLVKNKPSMSAKLMKALVHRKMPEAIFRTKHASAEKCVLEVGRDEKNVETVSLTRAECDRARFSMDFDKFKRQWKAKQMWEKLPEDMLYWRTVTKACRRVFSDCLMGVCYTPEELGDELLSPRRQATHEGGGAVASALNEEFLGREEPVIEAEFNERTGDGSDEGPESNS